MEDKAILTYYANALSIKSLDAKMSKFSTTSPINLVRKKTKMLNKLYKMLTSTAKGWIIKSRLVKKN